MNCPKCGKEMENGYLYGQAPLLWSERSEKKLLIARDGDEQIFDGGFPQACICKKCRKIIVDY